jgi:hypothetical protein
MIMGRTSYDRRMLAGYCVSLLLLTTNTVAHLLHFLLKQTPLKREVDAAARLANLL